MGARAILIATTMLYRDRFDETPYIEHPFPSGVETVMAADELTEFVGRSHNRSWHRPNAETATNRGYLREVIRRGKTLLMEHASATFYITGVSRGLARQLWEQRALAIVELSDRYVDYSEAEYVTPPALIHDDALTTDLADFFEDACDLYRDLKASLRAKGFGEREAHDAARTVLPSATETALVATGDMRAWRVAIEECNALSADAESRSLALKLLMQLKEIAPNTFQDIPFKSSPTADELSHALQSSAVLRVA